MSSEDPRVASWLADIVDFVDEIEALGLVDARIDRKTQLAAERILMMICEAVRRLDDAGVQIVSAVETRRIRAFGNRLRHEYDAVDPTILFEVIRDSLPALRLAADQCRKSAD